MIFVVKLTKLRGRRTYERSFKTREEAETYRAKYPSYVSWIEERPDPLAKQAAHYGERNLRTKRERRWHALSKDVRQATRMELLDGLALSLKRRGLLNVDAAAKIAHGEFRGREVHVELKLDVVSKSKPFAHCHVQIGRTSELIRGFRCFHVEAQGDGPTFESALRALRVAMVRNVQGRRADEKRWAKLNAEKAQVRP